MAASLHRALPAVALALNLVLMAAALAADRRDPRNRAFAAVTAALALWNAAVFGLRSAADADRALWWEWLVHLAVALVPVLFCEYVRVFLGVRRRGRAVIVAYPLAGAFMALAPTRWLVPGVRQTVWGYAPVPGPAYAAFLAYFYVYLVGATAALAVAVRRRRGGPGVSRARWILAGALVSLLGGAADFVRFIVGWENLYPVGIPANAIFALALGIAIVRYRLVDITVFMRRAVLYALASLALAPFVIGATYLSGRDGGGFHGAGPMAAALIAVGALALAMPLLRKLEALLDRVMFHREHGVRDALLELARELPGVTDVRGVARSLTRGLVTEIPLRSAGLYVPDPGVQRFRALEWDVAPDEDVPPMPALADHVLIEWLAGRRQIFVAEDEMFGPGADAAVKDVARMLNAVDVALAVPVFEDDALTAVVLVGEKRSGDAFTRDERDLLNAVAGHATIALRNARLYDDLRCRIQEAQEAQQQLMQSAKLAAIGELAASVAHEVNNPLMATLGHAGLLRRELPADAPAQARLDVIEEQTHRAAKILRGLLDFARRRERGLEPIDIREVLARSLELIGARLSRSGIVTDAGILGEVPLVIGDRDELTQVFVNLFNNALDAMPDDGTLRVRIEVRSAAGIPCLTVGVSDTGHGIGRDEITQIFEPFYTTKGDGKGTGLGLAVSLGIIRRHEGTIEVVSERGKGTTFLVSLPIASRP